MRVWGCLKIFLKSQFLGYCNILSPMYSMVCRKDTDVKEVSEKLKKEDDKKPSAWAERTNKRILPILAFGGQSATHTVSRIPKSQIDRYQNKKLFSVQFHKVQGLQKSSLLCDSVTPPALVRITTNPQKIKFVERVAQPV